MMYQKEAFHTYNFFLIIVSSIFFLLCITAGIELVPYLHEVVLSAIFIYLFLLVVRQLFFLAFALFDSPSQYKGLPQEKAMISIILPAYNEEDVIEEALTSLVNIQYPSSLLEILVVDDGSVDSTADRARRFIHSHKFRKIRIISQTNAGKAAALNTGIMHAQGDLLVCVDADSRLAPTAFDHVLSHFVNPKVGAVGGFIEVGNLHNVLTYFQQIEYLISLNFFRKALSFLGVVTIIPGPIGIFRKEAICEVGGYNEDRDLYAEDADLTVRLLNQGWKVRGDQSMVAYTEAPADLYSLLRQRYRWKRGIFQSFQLNIFSLLTTSSHRGVCIGLLLAIESHVLEICNFGITLFFLFHFFCFATLDIFLFYYLVLLAVELLIFIIVFRGRKKIFYLLGLFFLQKFSYSYLLNAWGVLALFDEWRFTQMSWDKLERAATLS